MARYQLKESGPAVSIRLTEVAGRQEELLGAFAACEAGQCSCPTDEYEKLATMDIKQGEDEILLRLEPKAGERFDLAEIASCLDHTTREAAEAEA